MVNSHPLDLEFDDSQGRSRRRWRQHGQLIVQHVRDDCCVQRYVDVSRVSARVS